MNRAVCITLLLGAWGVASIEAGACSCIGFTIEEQIASADYALAGSVVSIDTVDATFLKVIVAVDEVWKGAVTEHFVVWTHVESSACGYTGFVVGQKYVIYAYDPDARLDKIHTGFCTRTQKYSDAADLTVLGQGQTPLAADEDALPGAGAVLGAAFPNPTGESATIPFTLREPALVEMTIHDALGREVQTLVSGYFGAGGYEAVWEGTGQASGVYFCRLRVGKAVFTRVMMLGRW